MAEWTPEDEAKLKALFKKGVSYGQMMVHFGFVHSRGSIIGKAYRMGLKRGKVKDASVFNGRNMKRKRRRQENHSAVVQFPKPRSIRFAPEPFYADPDPLPPSLISTLDLLPHHCRAVYGEPKDGKHCGRKRVLGTSWCLFHLRRYLPDTALELSRKAETVAQTVANDQLEPA